MKTSSLLTRKFVYSTCFIVLLFLVGIDLASTLQGPALDQAVPVSQLKQHALPADYHTKVALVRSDDSFMNPPEPLNAKLTREEIIKMVYQVLDISGDLKPLLFAGAKITIKPNVVELADLENGVNTDPRVVEGLIRWLEERGPGKLQYTIAEGGGGWLPPEWKDTKYNSGGAPVGDGFERAGYYDMQKRLAADGINATILNSDFGTLQEPLKGIRLTPVPSFIEFSEYTSYWVNEAFSAPDLLINVPVMKIHTPLITVCLKNYIGTAAGVKYGNYKGMGGPDSGDPAGLHQDWPQRNSIEREIIDLASISPTDYCLVDALVGKERAKTASDPTIRRNMLVAGRDLVAVDSACAQLMGLNPDDVAHLCEAARQGLGTMDADKISFTGEHSIADSMYYYERPPVNTQGNRGHYGMNNRVWLLNAASNVSDIDTPYLGTPDAEVVATPGTNNWTEPILFSDDYIDFEAHYVNTAKAVFYAFCWITVPEEQDAELWINHDESCAVWINGQQVYRKLISYQDPAMPSGSSKTIHLSKGRFPLLVKLVDTTKTAPFVMNICRILPKKLTSGKATYTDLSIAKNYQRYEGTRVPGLKFDVGSKTGINNWINY